MLLPTRTTLQVSDVAVDLTAASITIGRLDQRLQNHPLKEAFLYRARLDAVRAQAQVDGQAIDPWHLAAVLEGLRLPTQDLEGADRFALVEAAQTAFRLYQWQTHPSATQRHEIARALSHLRPFIRPCGPLLGAASAFHDWLHQGGQRAPFRAALGVLWRKRGVMRSALPLTGPAALRAGAPHNPVRWVPVFLRAVTAEAHSMTEMLRGMERQWVMARREAGARRRHSRAPAAIDILAARPLTSATTLADLLKMSVNAALDLLERFESNGLVVEVTHRSARRLFALRGFEPLREALMPPRRLASYPLEDTDPALPDELRPSDLLSTLSGQQAAMWKPDFTELEAAMREADHILRKTTSRRNKPRL
ncbi:hypothetical protein AD940_02230 [Gluconobacter thailandicus]|uniref:hypothetical protein n=1 Tax=Gluconobacter thailandicus TaxID=257438 RepID=UPI0007777E08|nr:hypothetical protein [Gluconobacter thailandicus]KXV35586.1 hypothetical protein AD940_02230 [Gluconobacter thailandicus]